MAALSKKTAKDLDSMTKDQVKQLCGEAEGSRVFSQFSVQKANWEVWNSQTFERLCFLDFRLCSNLRVVSLERTPLH